MSESASQKNTRVMSGMRPTGPLHIGHYFGVLKNWIELQSQYTCFFGAMDWHAQMAKYKTPSEVDTYIRDNIAEWIAWGLDPEKCTIYVQSHVPETLELAMIFAVLTPMGWLERVNTWKDAIEEMKQNDTYTLGRFSYPVLQVADIALVGGSLVPVGQDNISHLEVSREIVRRFNSLYKAKLPEPKPLLTPFAALPGTDGRKMSSSYGNFLPLSEEAKPLEKRIKAMPTDPARVRREDPGNPEVCPVYHYHKLFSSQDDLKWVEQGCRTAGIGCGDCKARLFSNINGLYEKPREIKKELLHNTKRLDAIILEGSQKVREEAKKTLKVVRAAMKFVGGVQS
jgi:tryptophanyl-tRNA synthetase